MVFNRLTLAFVLLWTTVIQADPFVIEVVDSATGRGVPLVQLRTTASQTYYTDSQGIVAFDEPGWMNRRVFFYVESPGYELPANGFGQRGQQFVTTPGETGRIELPRTQIAERLYRVTGAGIYRDSVLAERPVPISNPLVNVSVVGSDSVVNAIYQGRIHWFWGDTTRQSTPLGNFQVPGATSQLPGSGGLDPLIGVELKYFVNDESEVPFAKETARMEGSGPTWINGLQVVPDEQGRQRLFASYVKIKPPLEVYRRGLCRWNDQLEQFEHVLDIPLDAAAYPWGHPLRVRQDDGEYLYFPDPLPLARVRASAEDLLRLDRYQCFTPLAEGTKLERKNHQNIRAQDLERTAEGQLKYEWKRNTAALQQRHEGQLVRAGALRNQQRLIQLRDRDTGEEIQFHGGSVYWNEHRNCWVSVFVQIYGKSMLGEIWYSEAATPLGPWAYAVRVATHGEYSFYNPKQHPMFDAEGGRYIFFEGTYTHSFSGNKHPTPWYEYNQLMYRLDLADPRLIVPRPVYTRVGSAALIAADVTDDRLPQQWATAGWFAADRPGVNYLAVLNEGGRWQTLPAGELTADQRARVLFYALPADQQSGNSSTVLLYEYTSTNDEGRYDVADARLGNEFHRCEQPLCRVWRSPWRE